MVLGSQEIDLSFRSTDNLTGAISKNSTHTSCQLLFKTTLDLLLPLEQNKDHLLVVNLLETIISWTQKIFGTEEFVKGREEFNDLFGKVFHDDRFFEERMHYFMHYFIFDRPLSSLVTHQELIEHIVSLNLNADIPSYPSTVKSAFLLDTPFSLFMKAISLLNAKISPSLFAHFARFQFARHSLFQVRSLKKNSTGDLAIVVDLISNKRLVISSSDNGFLVGLSKKDIFQGFIFPFHKQNVITRGMILHPHRTSSIILKFLKDKKTSKTLDERNILTHFSCKHLRHLRQPQTDPIKIYLLTL